MAETKLDIWNAALDHIGENDALEDENDSSIAAQVCRRHYDRCRKIVLSTVRWPFATHQQALQRLADETRVGWAYVYALPDDCLEPRILLGDGVRWGLTTPQDRTPFDRMSNTAGDGIVLCCDIGPSDFEVLEYTRNVELVSAFDPLFEDALGWRLAAELALGLKKSRAEWDRIMAPPSPGRPTGGEYWYALHLAGVMQQRGRQQDAEPESPSLTARR